MTTATAVQSLAKKEVRPVWLWTSLGMLLFVTCVVSLFIGRAHIAPSQILAALLAPGGSDMALVLWEIRVPRMILGMLVGASLGISGAAMQGFLRNPLAEPGLMGVSGGAAFGAVLTLYTGFSKAFPLALPLGGLAGAMVAVLLVYAFAGKNSSMQTLILAGVAINSLAGAGTALALNLSPDPHAALEITFWVMGSLSDRSFTHVLLAAPVMLTGWALLFGTGRALDALTLGEETAGSMGFRLSTLRIRMALGTALSVGAAVAVTGSIAFIGLVVPHLVRPFVRGEPGRLMGVSALGGAILILWADMCVRLISKNVEIKLGVLTALIGAPFFLALVLKNRKNMM